MTIILRIIAWLLAAAVTFATLGPPGYRPHSNLGQNGEHALAFILIADFLSPFNFFSDIPVANVLQSYMYFGALLLLGLLLRAREDLGTQEHV